MARLLALAILVLAAIWLYARGEDSIARTCEQEAGLTRGTAAFDDCYDRLQAADVEAKSMLFGGLLRVGG